MCALHFVETVWAYFLARIQIIEVVRLSLLARGCKLLTFSRPFLISGWVFLCNLESRSRTKCIFVDLEGNVFFGTFFE